MSETVLSIVQADALYAQARKDGFQVVYRSHNGYIGYTTIRDHHELYIRWNQARSATPDEPWRHGYVVTPKTPAAELWLAINVPKETL